MMFIDASALVSILTQESDGDLLFRRLLAVAERRTSAIAVYETALVISKRSLIPVSHAQDVVLRFLSKNDVQFHLIGEPESRAAVEAHVRYGKGRHPAALNMGDCFAYACAKLADAELLYKGEDFAQTDLAHTDLG